ncbi:hypothetical protein [Kitasatospora sp. NPDC058046]|uniref:hypothetical protein n=1 Tax=Kitasatospora sp. NPDC058046 TaxID=3346312 RepID=UPI0036DD5EE0
MADVPLDILDRLRQLEDQVRQLSGRAQMRPAMDQILAGDVVVGEGGTFKVNTLTGGLQFYVGKMGQANPDGSEQRGLLAYRQDGTQAIAVGRTTTVQAHPQAIVMSDARGGTIFAEDVFGGGLAAPVFGADGWYGYTEVPQWTTTSSSWATCMTLPWRKQHPQVQGHYLARCSDAATAGEIRLLDGVGSVIASVTLNAGDYIVGSVTGPISGAHLSSQNLVWQARVSAGSGTVGVRGLSTFGVGS